MNEEQIKPVNSEITIFSNDEFGQVRTTVDENGETLVCLVDVCRVLDLDPSQIVRRLDKEVVSKHPLSTKGGKQLANFVNEDGFYDVVLESRKPNAKKFRKWVTSEVLPAIRKTGMYAKDGDEVTLRQMMSTLADYMRSQQLVNQVMLETLQAFRAVPPVSQPIAVTPLSECSPRCGKPLFVVEVSIIPAGVRSIVDYFDSHSLGYTKHAGLSGSCHTFVLNTPVESSIVAEIKDIIRDVTSNTKWGRVKTIML